MNTKQIWTALSLNTITQPYFDGVYSRDTLKTIKETPGLIICNTDPSYKSGKHWILFYFENDKCEFYDSLGKELEYYGTEFVNFIKKFVSTYEESCERTQSPNTSLCGYYCIYYAYNRCKGYNMNNILNTMTSGTFVKNFVVERFSICSNSNCNFLQSAINY